jgi:hypothetical protein
MSGTRNGWIGALVLVMWTMLPGTGRAGPILDWCGWGKDCPRPSYSPLHYWTPSLYTCYAYHHDQRGVYATQYRYPEVPNSYRIIRYPCPAAPPEPPPAPDGYPARQEGSSPSGASGAR